MTRYPEIMTARGCAHAARHALCVIGFPLLGYASGCAARFDAQGSVAAAGASTVATGGAMGAAANPNFTPNAAPSYDEMNGLGSFEDNPGFGWDTCRTHTPEILSLRSDGSDGSTSMSFQSVDDGTRTEFPSEQPSASQLYLWSQSPSAPSETLYFDAKNLGEPAVSGSIRFYGTDLLCGDEELLVEVDLGLLELQATWATRCVTVAGLRTHEALGIAVTGGRHSIALDALRFGPPCRADR